MSVRTRHHARDYGDHASGHRFSERLVAPSSVASRADLANGRPLDPAVRDRLEPLFGHNFSRVRVHTDRQAAASAIARNARAYAHGNDIVFADGAYAPQTTSGTRLLAHELAHVVQQAPSNRTLAGGDERSGVAMLPEPGARAASSLVTRGERASAASLASAPVGVYCSGDETEAAPVAAAPASDASTASASSHGLDGFARDKAELSPAHVSSLDALVWGIKLRLDMLANGGTASFRIVGHTDTTGSESHNAALGGKRAAAVQGALRDALIANKVPESSVSAVTTESVGKADLAVVTKDAVDEPRNRRVHIEVTIVATPVVAPPPKIDLNLPKGYEVPLPYGPPRPAASVPDKAPSREWLEGALRRDKLLDTLPKWARDKAIDALKDADEIAAEKIIDALPWGAMEKQAATAAVKSILQLIKGRKFTSPPEPPRGADFGPTVEFPKAPGEKIFTSPTIRFNWP